VAVRLRLSLSIGEQESTMSFRIQGLSPEPFRHLYGLSDDALAAHGAKRYVADKSPGFPDRIELRDARVGESLLLVNHEHHAASSPYRSSYAIFVREGAEQTYDRIDEIPDVLSRRLLSLRGFSAAGMLLNADVVEGRALEPLIASFFRDPQIAYLHAHNARQGCYAARIDRA
jgi:Protein of unknown function (DUF1203)